MSAVNSVQSIADMVQTVSRASSSTLDGVGRAEQIDAFNSSYANAASRLEDISQPVRVAQLAASGAVDSAGSATSTPQQQTLKALELDKSSNTPATSQGDAILSGLGRLQGIFTSKQNTITSAINSTSMSAQSLMKIQMDMVQYTLLIDVASKVTGKVTQSVDTLVKGQ